MNSQDEKKEHSPYSILIADDEEDLLAICDYFFTREGLRVYTATSSLQALDIVFNNKIDAIFSDVCMPSVNGIELFEMTKAQGISFYATTGSYDPEMEGLWRRGVVRVFYKPYDLEECVTQIINDLKNRP